MIDKEPTFSQLYF